MLGKIYGTAQNLGNKFTGGMKEDLGKRGQLARMETSARRSVMGVDEKGNIISDNRRDRFRRYVGGRATRSQARMQNKEAEAKRLLEDDVMRDMENNQKAYVGVGADRGAGGPQGRVQLSVDKMDLKRQIEDLEPIKLRSEAIKLREQQIERSLAGMTGEDRVSYLADQTRQAMATGNMDDMKAYSNALMQQGTPGADAVGDIARQVAGTDQGAAFADHMGSHYPTLEEKTPETLDFVTSGGQNAPGASGAGSYGKVTASTIGKMSAKSLKTALDNGHIDMSIVQDALSERNRSSTPIAIRTMLEDYATRPRP